MVLEIISMLLAIAILAVIINGVKDYCKQRRRVNISFREAMDLVDLPVITFYNNGKKFNFLLDTGATLSVIDSNILGNFSHKKLDEKGTLCGIEGNRISVSYIKASLEHKGVSYEEDFQTVDMSTVFNQIKSESGITLSGILGSLFFKKYQYVLDFESLVAYSKK